MAGTRLAFQPATADNDAMDEFDELNSKPLCRLDDLTDHGSKGFTHNGQAIFAVRQGDRVFVYENSCPHRGIPLEWVPDQFLDASGRLIQCASHGALFLPDSGECVAGPCSGAYLKRRQCFVGNGKVWLD